MTVGGSMDYVSYRAIWAMPDGAVPVLTLERPPLNAVDGIMPVKVPIIRVVGSRR